MHSLITIESSRPHRPTESRYELSRRVYTATQEDALKVARKMLTAWCEANPGTPATYVVSGLSAQQMGQDW